jgi:rubrerythrin
MILTVVNDVGGKTTPTAMTVVAPQQEMPIEVLRDFAAGGCVDGRAFADLLSAFVTHERDGVHLYRVVAERTNNQEWRRRYEEFGAETARHVQVFEELIETLGGDPAYVSPSARMATFRNAKLLESALISGSVSQEELELADLESVLIAEMKCHDNWELLGDLAEWMPEGQVRDVIADAVDQVEDDEDKHLAWARDAHKQAVARMIISP